MRRIFILAAAVGPLILTGCANVTKGQQYAGFTEIPKEICIVQNPRVKMNQALSGITSALENRNIKYHLVANRTDCNPDCAYMLKYEARRSWDMTTYLGSANLRLFKNGELVARSDYKAGSATLTKWGKTEERLDGLVGELLGE